MGSGRHIAGFKGCVPDELRDTNLETNSTIVEKAFATLNLIRKKPEKARKFVARDFIEFVGNVLKRPGKDPLVTKEGKEAWINAYTAMRR